MNAQNDEMIRDIVRRIVETAQPGRETVGRRL